MIKNDKIGRHRDHNGRHGMDIIIGICGMGWRGHCNGWCGMPSSLARASFGTRHNCSQLYMDVLVLFNFSCHFFFGETLLYFFLNNELHDGKLKKKLHFFLCCNADKLSELTQQLGDAFERGKLSSVNLMVCLLPGFNDVVFDHNWRHLRHRLSFPCT